VALWGRGGNGPSPINFSLLENFLLGRKFSYKSIGGKGIFSINNEKTWTEQRKVVSASVSSCGQIYCMRKFQIILYVQYENSP